MYDPLYLQQEEHSCKILFLLSRVSRIAQDRLKDSRTVELQDLNNPEHIADMYSEIYNNQWAAAYEELNQSVRDGSETIKHLLQILQVSFSPLSTNGFFILVWLNIHGMAHCVHLGVTGYTIQTKFYFLPKSSSVCLTGVVHWLLHVEVTPGLEVYKTWVHSQTKNKGHWLDACGHVSASSQSLCFILSLRMTSSFITSRPDIDLNSIYFLW